MNHQLFVLFPGNLETADRRKRRLKIGEKGSSLFLRRQPRVKGWRPNGSICDAWAEKEKNTFSMSLFFVFSLSNQTDGSANSEKNMMLSFILIRVTVIHHLLFYKTFLFSSVPFSEKFLVRYSQTLSSIPDNIRGLRTRKVQYWRWNWEY